jgi:hypothetical protein
MRFLTVILTRSAANGNDLQTRGHIAIEILRCLRASG